MRYAGVNANHHVHQLAQRRRRSTGRVQVAQLRGRDCHRHRQDVPQHLPAEAGEYKEAVEYLQAQLTELRERYNELKDVAAAIRRRGGHTRDELKGLKARSKGAGALKVGASAMNKAFTGSNAAAAAGAGRRDSGHALGNPLPHDE